MDIMRAVALLGIQSKVLNVFLVFLVVLSRSSHRSARPQGRMVMWGAALLYHGAARRQLREAVNREEETLLYS